MHKLCFFLAFALISCLGYARPITEKEAIQVAKDFLYQKTALQAKAFNAAAIVPQFSVAYTCLNETKAATRSSSVQEACYYVINVNDNDGYVIVAGDDRARQILAYSHDGSFNPDNVPVNCLTWLQGYQKEISCLLDLPDENEEVTSLYRSVTYPTVVIEPMTTSKWGQGTPYNLQCPIDESAGKNELSASGCTATATAQIMYYYKWPARPTGSIVYEDKKQNVTRSMNFDERPAFDWENMLEVYPYGGGTEVQENAVANLMVCVGYASQMAYSASASGAALKNAALGLRNYFNYDENIYCYESKYTPTAEWVEVLMRELTAGRPILYSGYNEQAGHAFVCDGYNGDGLFHFNWGWGGSSDGYYALTSLYPGYQGIGGSNGSYTFLQSMVTNIQPPTDDSVPQEDMLVIKALYSVDKDQKFYTNEALVVNKGDRFGVGLYYNNIGLSGFSGKMCVGVIQNGQIVPLTSKQDISLGSGVPDKWFFTWLDVQKLSVGEYEVYYFYKGEYDTEWIVLPANQVDAKCYLMTIDENTIKIEKQKPNFSLQLSEAFDPGKIYNTGSKVWLVYLVNNGDVRLEGKVGVRIQKAGGDENDTDLMFSSLGYCDPGEKTVVRVTGELGKLDLGEYVVTPYYCSVNGIYATVTRDNIVPLCEGIDITIGLRPSITIPIKEEGYILDKKDNILEVTVSQPSSKRPWEGHIYGKIFKITGEGIYDKEDTNIALYSDYLVMNKPTTITTQLHAESVDLPTGDDYQIVFYLDDGNEEALAEGALSIVNTATSVQEESIPDLNISLDKGQAKLHVSAGVALDRVSVISLSGSCMQAMPANGNNRVELPVNDFPAGIYIVQVETENQMIVRKILIP